MLSGPIFRREVKAASRGNGLFAYRVLVGTFVGGVAAAAGLVLFGPGTGPAAGPAVYEAGSLRAYALIVLAAALGIQVTFEALLAAAVVGAGIAEEREKDTLPLLLLTRLTRLELAATKLAGRLVPVFLQLLTGLPFLAIAAWWAGLPAPLAVEILAAMASTIAVAGSLGILASSRKARSAAAQQEAAGWTMFWLVVLPLIARMPARSGTIWGDLLVELRRLASWIAPSSPLSLLFDWSWFSGGPDLAGPLSDRLRTM